MANARIDYPAVFAASPSVVVSTVGTGTQETLPLNLTIGREYWLSGDNSPDSSAGNGDLMRMLSLAIANYAAAPTLTCAVTLNTGYQTHLAASEAMTIHWTAGGTTPGLAEYFGFSSAANTSFLSTGNSPNQPYGIWRPGRSTSKDSRERQTIVGGMLMALSGEIEFSRVALPTKPRDITIALIQPERMLQEYATTTRPYDTWEQLWLDGATKGHRLRLYMSELAVGSSDYRVYKLRDAKDPVVFNGQHSYWRDVSLALQGAI